MKNYIARGFVIGTLWGGGEGAYPSTRIEAKTKKALLEQAEKMLADGSLDSGMGYESLSGALLDIEIVTTIVSDGKDFFHSDYESIYIGKLSEKQRAFLDECSMNQ